MFSDLKTHVMGVADNEKLASSDSGYQHAYAFRTPRSGTFVLQGPICSGKIQTLEDVLSFYEDRERPCPKRYKRKPRSLALKLNVDFKNINTIIEFLNTLTTITLIKDSASVPNGLPVAGRIKS